MTDSGILMHSRTLLDEVYEYLERISWGEKYMSALRTMRDELSSPCVLAVAGKVKAGKSFLINALLGVDLAMTGSTETTATINVFQKGRPPSSDTPILCQWIDGSKEWKSKAFLDVLQGTGDETLKMTAKIDKLIFYIEGNSLLEDVILVDTPGIGADVGDEGDAHQQHTEAYFQLRERHQKETNSLSKSADAVIYLFNTVPTETDKTFIASLYQGGQGLTALNGIGVLSKVDKDLRQIENIDKFAKDFEKELFTIKPTAAAVYRYLPDREQAQKWQRELREGFSREKGIKLALLSQTTFLRERLPDCTIPLERRKAMLGEFASKDLPWSTFQLVASELYCNDNVDDALEHLAVIAGIDPLRKLINDHFFSRSRLLRAGKILTELKHVLSNIEYSEYFLEAAHWASMKEPALQACSTLSEPYRSMVMALIKRYVDGEGEVADSQAKILSFKHRVEMLLCEMADINNCYLAYQKVVAAPSQFSAKEFVELNALLTAKPSEKNYRQRQNYWAVAVNVAPPNSVRQMVAQVAKTQYARLLKRL